MHSNNANGGDALSHRSFKTGGCCIGMILSRQQMNETLPIVKSNAREYLHALTNLSRNVLLCTTSDTGPYEQWRRSLASRQTCYMFLVLVCCMQQSTQKI